MLFTMDLLARRCPFRPNYSHRPDSSVTPVT
jgi:hypothetical protein